ncbi:MAG: DUF4013 domain-containing protein [Candidatus Diapherotrites archaeon]|nr:DUF4013 domain-containing protein [Candidatus Diapherotrites archaeon]
MNIGAALGKPFNNIVNLVIGIVLMAIPLLNILTIPGYFLRIAKRTMDKDNKLPGFENFGELVVNSIKVIIVGIVYAIIWMIVSFILMFIPLIGPVLVLVCNIVFMFIALSAMMTLAKSGNIGEALGIPTVAKKAMNVGFIVSVIVGGIITAIVMGVVFVILLVIAGASLLPSLTPLLTGGVMDPAALATLIPILITSFAVGMVVLVVVEYIMMVFFYSLVAESYQA